MQPQVLIELFRNYGPHIEQLLTRFSNTLVTTQKQLLIGVHRT